MRSTFAGLGSVLLGVVLLVSGQGLLNLLVVLRLELTGASTLLVALVMGAYFAGQVVGSLGVVRLVARVGHIRAFSGFMALLAAAALGHGLCTSAVVLVSLRLFNGACFVGALAVAEGWLSDRAPDGKRGLVLSLYTSGFYLALGGGQVLAGLGDPQGQSPFMLAGILVALGAVPVAFTSAPAPRPPEAGFLDPRSLYRRSPLAVAGAITAGATYALALSLGPGFLHAAGLEPRAIGLVLAGGVLSGLVLQWPVGQLSDRLDRRSVMQGLVAAMTAGCLLSLAAPLLGPWAVALSVAALTAWMIPLYPLALAHASDRLPPERLVAGSATLLLLSALGASAGPLVAAWVTGWLGRSGLFATASVVVIALLALITWRRRILDSEEELGVYRPVPRTTAQVSELDPRVKEAG
jgi:MFS family permease